LCAPPQIQASHAALLSMLMHAQHSPAPTAPRSATPPPRPHHRLDQSGPTEMVEGRGMDGCLLGGPRGWWVVGLCARAHVMQPGSACAYRRRGMGAWRSTRGSVVGSNAARRSCASHASCGLRRSPLRRPRVPPQRQRLPLHQQHPRWTTRGRRPPPLRLPTQRQPLRGARLLVRAWAVPGQALAAPRQHPTPLAPTGKCWTMTWSLRCVEGREPAPCGSRDVV
jgi:hypothetical protein